MSSLQGARWLKKKPSASSKPEKAAESKRPPDRRVATEEGKTVAPVIGKEKGGRIYRRLAGK